MNHNEIAGYSATGRSARERGDIPTIGKRHHGSSGHGGRFSTRPPKVTGPPPPLPNVGDSSVVDDVCLFVCL